MTRWHRETSSGLPRQRISVIFEVEYGAYVMTRIAAGAHLPTPWLFEPTEYAQLIEPITAWTCLDCSLLPSALCTRCHKVEYFRIPPLVEIGGADSGDVSAQ